MYIENMMQLFNEYDNMIFLDIFYGSTIRHINGICIEMSFAFASICTMGICFGMATELTDGNSTW